jgi:hypothetical protein
VLNGIDQVLSFQNDQEIISNCNDCNEEKTESPTDQFSAMSLLFAKVDIAPDNFARLWGFLDFNLSFEISKILTQKFRVKFNVLLFFENDVFVKL